jgi:hypothetical protein
MPRLQLVAQYLFKRTNTQFILKTNDLEVMSDILLQMLSYSTATFWEQIMKPMFNDKNAIYSLIVVRTAKAMLDAPGGIFWNNTATNSTSANSQSQSKEILTRSEIERIYLASFKHVFVYASEQAGVSIGLNQFGYFPSSIVFGTYFEQFPLLVSSSGSGSGVACVCVFVISWHVTINFFIFCL